LSWGDIKICRNCSAICLNSAKGDALHSVLCEAGYKSLLRIIARRGLGLLLRLLQESGLKDLFAKLAKILAATERKAHISAGRWLEMSFAGAIT
jgi:hypothetical protein